MQTAEDSIVQVSEKWKWWGWEWQLSKWMLTKAKKYNFRLISSDKLSPNIYFRGNSKTLFKRKKIFNIVQEGVYEMVTLIFS